MKHKHGNGFIIRRLFVILLLFIQIAFIIRLIINGSRESQVLNIIFNIISIFTVLYIVSKKEKGSFKLIWIILILIFPVFGGILYFIFNYQTSIKSWSDQLTKLENETNPLYFIDNNDYKNALNDFPQYTSQIRYLQKFAKFPIYSHTSTQYLSPGEIKYEHLIQELKQAQHYIFLEYFTIHKGYMWNTILDILKQKASEGVLVRVIYDDFGSFLVLPENYPSELRKYGIECAVFNPVHPLLRTTQNNRDHRKLAIIDGITAFTGGINLADEYINVYPKYGHWKDAAIMLKGKGVWSFTLMFLQMWSFCTKTKETYSDFYPHNADHLYESCDGYVQPYADSPMDKENVGEHVYLHIINQAKDYIYINTPYLIIDDSVLSALTLAAKSGVDVRIVTPHKWDKWPVHMTTRSYYRDLIRSGVKVYEYSIGFIHSKTFVADDMVATVGTTNLDFRSLYHHFECGVKLYNCSAVMDLKKDFLDTLQVCHQITEKECSHNFIIRLIQDILRIFAPIM